MKKVTKFINNNLSKIVLILCLIVFVLSLIPLFQISQYNQPSRDDFNFGYYLHNSHDTIGDVFASAFKGAQNTFQQWQGLFVVNFLLAIVPSAIKSEYYIITAYAGIVLLILSTWFFARQLLYRLLKFKLNNYRIVLLLVLIINIQLLPSAVQGFYWYPAVVTYTIPYCIMLTLFGIVLAAIKSDKNMTLKWIFAILFAVLVSGCNYITVLTSLLGIALYVLYTAVIKKDLSKFALITMLTILPGFIISVLAPGNSVRGESFESMSAIGAVLISFPAAARSILDIVFNMTFISMFAAIIPFVYITINEHQLRISYKYPLVVLFFSFCLYAATFAPTYYAMHGTGLGRIENIRMFTLVWLIVINIYYFFGWIKSYRDEKLKDSDLNDEKYFAYQSKVIKHFTPTIALLLIVATIGSIYTSNANEIACISAYKSLQSGEAMQYEAEHIEREKLYESDKKDIVIESLTVHPHILFFWEVSDGVSGNRSYAIEKYYGKDTVTLK